MVTKHIVSFSGGKDSTCMLLRMIQAGMHIDEIVFVDTGMEFPQMYDHIKKVEEYTGMDITIIRSEYTFEYYMTEYQKTKGTQMDVKGYQWPTGRVRWCTKHMKIIPFEKYIKEKYKGCDIDVYIGIAKDEEWRAENNKNELGKKIYPLIFFGITESMALEYCYERGFNWGGLYNDFSRVSCYCCPLKKTGELRTLYYYYPELWNKIRYLDSKVQNRFRSYYTLEELEAKFEREKEEYEYKERK